MGGYEEELRAVRAQLQMKTTELERLEDITRSASAAIQDFLKVRSMHHLQ